MQDMQAAASGLGQHDITRGADVLRLARNAFQTQDGGHIAFVHHAVTRQVFVLAVGHIRQAKHGRSIPIARRRKRLLPTG